MKLRTANEDEVQEIFEIVDSLIPFDVQKRVKLGENLARQRGLTLYEQVRDPNRIFNRWIHGLNNAV